MSLRPIKQIIQTQPTIEGAGVKLQRAFGFGKTKDFDPFLLLDDFRDEKSGGLPRRGIPLAPRIAGSSGSPMYLPGLVEHGDSLGNKVQNDRGDVQWMTAGSGIGCRCPRAMRHGRMHGFQLWGQPAFVAENDAIRAIRTFPQAR